jgi:hypothetical protein
MLGVMAVLKTNMARNAQVIVLARGAGNEAILWEFLDARVAGAGRCGLLRLLNESGLGLVVLAARSNSLGGAVDDLAVLDETLNHPVILTAAVDAAIDAFLAKVKIALVTGAAVVMLIWDRKVAVVAVDRVGAGNWASWRTSLVAKSRLTLVGNTSELCKPLLTSGSSMD